MAERLMNGQLGLANTFRVEGRCRCLLGGSWSRLMHGRCGLADIPWVQELALAEPCLDAYDWMPNWGKEFLTQKLHV